MVGKKTKEENPTASSQDMGKLLGRKYACLQTVFDAFVAPNMYAYTGQVNL